MKRKRFSLLAVIVLIAICLLGCSSDKGFTRAKVVDLAKAHGMARIEGNGDANTLKSMFDSSKVSSYYIARDLTDAQAVYDRYVNASNKYPLCEVNDVVVLFAFDKRLQENDKVSEIKEDRSELTLLVLNSEAGAEKLYQVLINDLFSDTTPVKGKKNGYSYAVDYSYVDDGKDKRGIYLKGKSILIIEGMSFGKGDYFGDYVFRDLKILDPGEV